MIDYELDPLEMILNGRLNSGLGGRWYGLYPALVTDIQDPDGQARVKVSLPWAPDTGSDKYEAWGRLATLMAGNNRGSWFVPEVNDEVVVGFEAGDPRRPYVLGALWNGSDAAPDSLDGSRNIRKVLRSRNGVKITLDDSDGKERFIAETPGGQKVTLSDGPGSVNIQDSNGNSVKLETSGITVATSAKVTVNATTVEVSASMVTVNAAMSKFSGMVQADVVKCHSIISESYTPGAGNIW